MSRQKAENLHRSSAKVPGSLSFMAGLIPYANVDDTKCDYLRLAIFHLSCPRCLARFRLSGNGSNAHNSARQSVLFGCS